MFARLQRVMVLLLCVGLMAVAQEPPEIPWEKGPCVGRLGTMAEIQVPKGFLFTGKDGAKLVMERTHNIPSGSELGVLMPIPKDEKDEGWFVIFKFSPIGYVKDDEKNNLDADAILASIKTATDKANDLRRSKGWSAIDVIGWTRKPFYDPRTNNLTWAILGRDATTQDEVVNHSVRLLGRTGYMNTDLILSKQMAPQGIPVFDHVMEGFRYTSGQTYAEFRKGDNVAAIGLTALVAGGAGAVLAKSGLLGKLWKFLVFAVIGVIGFFKKLFTGKKQDSGT